MRKFSMRTVFACAVLLAGAGYLRAAEGDKRTVTVISDSKVRAQPEQASIVMHFTSF